MLKPFLQPIAASAAKRSAAGRAPYQPSPVTGDLLWDPTEKIRRSAPGSDNWPLIWMDDNALLTAYGDGWGFEPKVDKKLSLGFARIEADAADHLGINLRSPTGEHLDGGSKGPKASGLLMVDRTVYLLARNAGNARLAWSEDRGATWIWSDWKFNTSFGCPGFVNFGRNYAGASNQTMYIVSPDSDSAYHPADRMVMARVDKDHPRERDAYEFLTGVDESGQASWSKDISRRGAVFEHPGRCDRGGMTYNTGLRRYLWCQTLPESTDPDGPRFQGGFGIYDAPNPWRPWTTMFFIESGDVGPGESSSTPTKGISSDGRTIHLVFSGDDAFSVRRAVVRPPSP